MKVTVTVLFDDMMNIFNRIEKDFDHVVVSVDDDIKELINAI